MKKKQLLALTLLGAMTLQTTGCTVKDITAKKPQTKATGTQTENSDVSKQTDSQTNTNMIPLSEIQKQAENLNISYPNLDLSNAKITIPDASEVYDITFPLSTDSFERQVEKLCDNIRIYEGLEKDIDPRQHITVIYWDTKENDSLAVPLNKADDSQKEAAQYLSYNDGTCSEFFVLSNFMLEMGDYTIPAKLTGDQKDYAQSVTGKYGCNLGSLYKRYDLAKDDISGISYHLSDGDVAIKDAIAYVEKHMKEDYHFVGSKHLDYHVFGVTVRKLEENTYYYEFDVSTSYKGLSLNKDDCFYIPSDTESKKEDSLELEPFGANHLVSMFQKDRLGFIWSCCESFETVTTNHTYQKLLSLEDACRLLSDYISDHKAYDISSVELIYQTEYEYNNKGTVPWGNIQAVHASPAYHFTVAKTGLAQYRSRLYFDVDAISGKITPMSH